MSYVAEPRWQGAFLPFGASGLYRSPMGMVRGRAVAFRRGVGDVLNPTAGSSLDCGLFAGGVFNPACWCLQFPSLCSKSTYTAAVALANPDLIYGSGPPAPAAVPAVAAGTSTVPVPYTADEFTQAVNDAIDSGVATTKAATSSYFADVQAALDAAAAGQGSPDSSTPTWVWVALAAAVGFGLLAVAKR